MHSNSAGIYQFSSSNKNLLKKIFLNNLIKTIGVKGELILPVYNYDFTKKKPFYLCRINSQVGELSNFFLENFKITRTLNPIFSHAILKSKKKYVYDVKDCLGKNSFFKVIYERNFKIFGFCSPLNTMTFLHHVECCNNVGYRFNKNFTSFLITKNKKKKMTVSYNVGKKENDYTLKSSKIEKALNKAKSFKVCSFGRFLCWSVDAKDVFKIITNKIKQKENYLIK